MALTGDQPRRWEESLGAEADRLKNVTHIQATEGAADTKHEGTPKYSDPIPNEKFWFDRWAFSIRRNDVPRSQWQLVVFSSSKSLVDVCIHPWWS